MCLGLNLASSSRKALDLSSHSVLSVSPAALPSPQTPNPKPQTLNSTTETSTSNHSTLTATTPASVLKPNPATPLLLPKSHPVAEVSIAPCYCLQQVQQGPTLVRASAKLTGARRQRRRRRRPKPQRNGTASRRAFLTRPTTPTRMPSTLSSTACHCATPPTPPFRSTPLAPSSMSRSSPPGTPLPSLSPHCSPLLRA
jgi:hypothetical protein